MALPDYAYRRRMMVDTQIRPSDVTKFPIIDAMLNVPRELYVPAAKREMAYIGENIDFAPGRAILDPRSFAKFLDALDLDPEDVVLDVGCAWGYSTAVLARLVDFVVGVEEDEALAAEAQSLLSEQGVDNAAVIAGPLVEGAAKSGPYDAILLGSAVERVPQTLIDQLKEGGRIGALFNVGRLGVARIGHKHDRGVSWRDEFNAGAPVMPGFEEETAFTF